jgi:hypothetical protein
MCLCWRNFSVTGVYAGLQTWLKLWELCLFVRLKVNENNESFMSAWHDLVWFWLQVCAFEITFKCFKMNVVLRLVENSTKTPITCYISFRTVNFPCFLPCLFPVLHLRLSNDTLRPTFNAISHKWHARIVNREPSLLYSILHFTYSYQNIMCSQNRHDILKQKKTACSFVT